MGPQSIDSLDQSGRSRKKRKLKELKSKGQRSNVKRKSRSQTKGDKHNSRSTSWKNRKPVARNSQNNEFHCKKNKNKKYEAICGLFDHKSEKRGNEKKTVRKLMENTNSRRLTKKFENKYIKDTVENEKSIHVDKDFKDESRVDISTNFIVEKIKHCIETSDEGRLANPDHTMECHDNDIKNGYILERDDFNTRMRNMRNRQRHCSETIVKEVRNDPVENEEYITEKRDLSKEEVLESLSNDHTKHGRVTEWQSIKKTELSPADVILHLIKIGTITVSQTKTELAAIIKGMYTCKTLANTMTCRNDVEDENHYKIKCTKLEEYDDENFKDCGNEKVEHKMKELQTAVFEQNVEISDEHYCKTFKQPYPKKLKKTKKKRNPNGNLCKEKPKQPNRNVGKRRAMRPVYPKIKPGGQCVIGPCVVPHPEYPEKFKFTGGRDEANFGKGKSYKKGDNPSWNETTDSDSDRQHSHGSQRSDEQEETEKEKGRRNDDEKDRDENEQPPVDSGNHDNCEDRTSRNLEVIANFKYRRKHGTIPGGETGLIELLGLVLNETDEMKVPPDIFEQINLCLMTSMQVKSAGETTMCYVCSHLSALISHFGSCTMGYPSTCSRCLTLFILIQKHMSACGFSDSFNADVTCPVIICVKIKRSEVALDNNEKVWKKLKKNLARFANPDLVLEDDDPFTSMSSIDSMSIGARPLPGPRTRYSTITRPILESIPEAGGRVELKSPRTHTANKTQSRSEPIMMRKPDGTVVMTSSQKLPKRFMMNDETGQGPASIPQSRFSSVGPRGRMVSFTGDLQSDSTDHPFQPEAKLIPPGPISPTDGAAATVTHLTLEGLQITPSYDGDGVAQHSLPTPLDESLEPTSGSNEYISLPGRVFGHDNGSNYQSIPIPRQKSEIADRYFSVVDRPTGIPGIQDVVYGERAYLLTVARIWSDIKNSFKSEKKDSREEGVILPDYQNRLKILKTRYSKNFQWVRLSHLGSGTSGKCHLAMDFNTDFKFCIKKIHISKYEVNELEIWSELKHRNIVPLIGTLRRGEKIYIMSEFIDGGCLTETINSQRALNRRLSQRTALVYLKQILQALLYLEKKFVIHEDLKADNILVRSGTQDIVITDFGVARKWTSSTDKRGSTSSGSQIVFSPEKARGEGHGFKSDLWSAICVMVHMLTGHPPWVKRYPNIGNLIYKIIEEDPDIPANINPDVIDLMKKGFNKDPKLRPSTEELLKHRAFKIIGADGDQPETFYSTLHSTPYHLNDTKIPETDRRKESEAMLQGIEKEINSINLSTERSEVNQPERNRRSPQEHEETHDTRKNSSFDYMKLAVSLGISLPEDVKIQETEPPDDPYSMFLLDSGEITYNPTGLEERESISDHETSGTEQSGSGIDISDDLDNLDLPKFSMLFSREDKLTDKEREEKKKRGIEINEYTEHVLMKQLSETESQYASHKSFDSSSSSRNESSDITPDRLSQIVSMPTKSSLEVPNLTLFNESSSISSDKLTLKGTSGSSDGKESISAPSLTKSPQANSKDSNNAPSLTKAALSPLALPSSGLNSSPSDKKSASSPSLATQEIRELPKSRSSESCPALLKTPQSPSEEGSSDNLSRPSSSTSSSRPNSLTPSIITSLISITEEAEDIPDDDLFGSAEGSDLLKPSTLDESVVKFLNINNNTKRSNLLKGQQKLHLDLSPASRRKNYANSKPGPNTADILSSTSPLPPTAPYYTPQTQRPNPFPSAVKSKSNSNLKMVKSTSKGSTENSGAWSSSRSQQEEIEKLLEELSNNSGAGAELNMSQEIEDHHPMFGLEDDDDMEASILYVRDNYLNSSPSHGIRLTVHHDNGMNFTMEISGEMVKQPWKYIIQNECADHIQNSMGVNRFLLKDSHNNILDLQQNPKTGDQFVYVQEVEDPTAAPWYCEHGMITE